MKLFGTDGIRCKAGEYPLDRDTLYVIGESLSEIIPSDGQPLILIGRDTRESGQWIFESIASGILSMGGEVYNCGVMPTPAVAYLTRNSDADGGISISASHNPFYDNGLKIFDKNGYKLPDEQEQELELLIDSRKDRLFDFSDKLPEVQNKFSEKYISFLLNTFSHVSLKGLKVVLDCAHGASSNMAGRVFEALGAVVTLIGSEPDGVNINDNVGSQHTQQLSRKVVETSSDFGVAFDGDGDRAVFVSPDGTVLDGDFIMYVLACAMHEKGLLRNSTLVSTVMSNLGLEKVLSSAGINMVRTDVGDKQVLQCMLNENFNLGGEQSGHIICLDHATTGDGLLTALKVVEVMMKKNRSLKELTSGMVKYPQILLNVPVKRKPAMADNVPISNAIREGEQRMENKGRVLVRYSGTEPLARVMLEGESDSVISEIASYIAEIIRTELN